LVGINEKLMVNGSARNWLGRVGLALLAAAVLFGRIDVGDRSVRYAMVAKSILYTGDWVQMHMADEPYYSKPPLCFWATAIAFRHLGVSVATSRLFAALCSFGTVLLLYATVRCYRSEAEALMAGAILCLIPSFIRICGDGDLDGPQLFFLALAVWGYARGTTGRRTFPLIFIGLGCGLGALTKSPFPLLLFLVFLLHAALTRQMRRLLRPWFWLGLVLGATVVLPWYMAMISREPEFLQLHFGQQMADRVLSDGKYATVVDERPEAMRQLMTRLLPWTLLALAGVWLGIRACRQRRGGYPLLLFLYMLVLGGGTYLVRRLSFHYNVPLFLPIVALAAYALGHWLSERARDTVPRVVFGVAVVALVAVTVLPVSFRGSRWGALRRMAPAIRTLVPPGQPVIGCRLLADDAVSESSRPVFFFCDRLLDDHDDPAEVVHMKPFAVLSSKWAFAKALEPAGYRAVQQEDDLTLAVYAPPEK
jgi:4-amino-4-deoxy-L-arabinose transferase-like glycosyltransferase